MPIVLILEIASALVALIALCLLLVHLVRVKLLHAPRGASPDRHGLVAMVMCGAAAVHGACAVLYGSGAPFAAYACGWLALLAFLASGACMSAPVRSRFASATSCHILLFAIGSALVVVHAAVAHT